MDGAQKPSNPYFIKGKVFPLHTLKVYRGHTDIAPPILDLNTSWRWVVNLISQPLYSWGRIPVSEDGWAPGHVWTFWRNLLAPTRIRTPDCPTHCLVTIQSVLSCLPSSLNFPVSNVSPSERAAGETWFGKQPFNEPTFLKVHCESTQFIEFWQESSAGRQRSLYH